MTGWATLRRLAAWAAALLSAAVAAQTIELQPSAVAACLTVQGDAGKPSYPFAAYKAGESGQVLVELFFTGADLAPEVQVVSSSGQVGFADAVRQHARDLRVPCLPAGGTARLRREYVFAPDRQQVVWSVARDMADPARQQLLRCSRHVSGEKAPPYPRHLQRTGQQGRVWATWRFSSDDQAPEAVVHAHRDAEDFVDGVKAWLQGLRLPCYAGEAIRASAVFVFRLDDDQFGFKPLDLPGFVVLTDAYERDGFRMDTSTMGCPFDLKLVYRQPWAANTLGQLGQADPRRLPLLQWLAQARLALPDRMLGAVQFDTADVHVPCARYNVPAPGKK